jgi:hypothetical protein
MHNFCISCFPDLSLAMLLKLCNNVNAVCGAAEAGSLFHFLKKKLARSLEHVVVLCRDRLLTPLIFAPFYLH